jgi:GntR family transcriptional repressor for pyruvate dehydrogenase complex
MQSDQLCIVGPRRPSGSVHTHVSPTPPNRKIPPFETLDRERRLSDRVADELLETILSCEMQTGDRLPSERDLAEQFGVSRTVVREAVRSLAAKGAVEARSGSGLRVAAVDASVVSLSMRLFIRSNGGLDYAKVNEVRMALETSIAAAAAERATPNDLEVLDALHERMVDVIDDVEQASLADVEFHRAIARSTHNELYLVMLDSIRETMLNIRRATIGLHGRKALRYHRKILERITAHDVEGAREAMSEHLLDAKRLWERVQAKSS